MPYYSSEQLVAKVPGGYVLSQPVPIPPSGFQLVQHYANGNPFMIPAYTEACQTYQVVYAYPPPVSGTVVQQEPCYQPSPAITVPQPLPSPPFTVQSHSGSLGIYDPHAPVIHTGFSFPPKAVFNNPTFQESACRNQITEILEDDNVENTRQTTTGETKENKSLKTQTSSVRYDSDDSGIAESPRSLASANNWTSCDEVSTDTEGTRIESEKNAVSSAHNDSSLSKMVTSCSSYDKTNEELRQDEEKYWTVADDERYWEKVRQRPPSNVLASTIANQIDYYLSDEYLAKDKYLLRQIRCKKDGFISIKLITSFKKVKKTTKDWSVVRSAIVRKSKIIVVSQEGLRIRRKTNLSEHLRKPRLLTSVLVIRLPEAYNLVERVTSLFKIFGEIGYVRLLRADKEVPTDLRNYATQVPDIGKTLCAIIDFETSVDALASVRILKYFQRQTLPCSEVALGDSIEDCSASADKYKVFLEDLPSLGDMRLALLGPRVRRTLYRQDRISEYSEKDQTLEEDDKSCLDKAANQSNEDLQGRKEKRDGSSSFLNSVAQPWSPSRTRREIAKVNDEQVYAIRSPKGPEDHKGFLLKRSVLL